VEIEGRSKLPPGQEMITGVCVTDKNYFQTMQVPLRRGRLFTEQEATGMRHVVVINEAFARKHFLGEDPLGKRVTIDMKDQNEPTEIIGIVADSRHESLDAEAEPMAYWPQPELTYTFMTLDVRTMESLLGRSISRARFNTLLLAVFAAVALVLAAVGIYGVMAYSVAQRTHEIGIRMALGAVRRDVLKMVVGQGMLLAAGGIGIGLAGAFLVTRLMGTLLYGVTPTDPATFSSIALLLLGVAFLA